MLIMLILYLTITLARAPPFLDRVIIKSHDTGIQIILYIIIIANKFIIDHK